MVEDRGIPILVLSSDRGQDMNITITFSSSSANSLQLVE